jgi:hypothetical protein
LPNKKVRAPDRRREKMSDQEVIVAEEIEAKVEEHAPEAFESAA